jgi:hypothetical protein
MQNKLQIPMFTNNPEWVPPDELPDLSSAKEIAIDLETRDPNLKNKGPGWPTKDGEVIGYAIATSFWSGYLPVKHLGGGNLDEGLIKRWLQKQLNTGADKIMHNAQYDLGWLRAEGFDVRGRVIDTMVTANLLDENRFSYSLNALGYDYLGKVKSEKGLIQAARDFGVDPKERDVEAARHVCRGIRRDGRHPDAGTVDPFQNPDPARRRAGHLGPRNGVDPTPCGDDAPRHTGRYRQGRALETRSDEAGKGLA